MGYLPFWHCSSVSALFLLAMLYPQAGYLGQACSPRFLAFHQLCETMVAPDGFPPRHRTHVSRMSSDRYKRLIKENTFTMFVQGAGARTVPLCKFFHVARSTCKANIRYDIKVVNENTTTTEIMETLARRQLIPSKYHEDYLLALCKSPRYRIPGWETMSQLGIGSLSHLHLRVQLLGGSSEIFWGQVTC